jgi:hypothetical protein
MEFNFLYLRYLAFGVAAIFLCVAIRRAVR